MADQRSRILTLVFTDLADSTALKTLRGDDAVDALIMRHREHVVRLAEACSGRVIDWAGDGCFLTFETSSAAVMFALQLQQAHAEESDLPAVRIGVHLGEITERPGPTGLVQVKGLAVDVAARVQGLAKPGQVLMSSSVYNSARQRMGVDTMGQPILWQLHGLYDLKGMDHPLEIGEAGLEGMSPLLAPEAGEKARPVGAVSSGARRLDFILSWVPTRQSMLPVLLAIGLLVLGVAIVYLLMTRLPDAPTPGSEPGSADIGGLSPITSLAVLPLENMSSDPEQEYFADGMTEAITAELAKIRALKVISRTSVMRYKGTQLSMREIAGELGVEGLVEGSVFRDGDDVRITVQLIDGRRDVHIWAESYTNTITSVLKLQSEVALAIAQAIGAELTPDEQLRIAGASLVDREAYDAYLKGWELVSGGTEESLTRALAYLKRAQELDPDMAEAWAAEARAHWNFATALNRPMSEQIEKVRIAASRALALDETQFYGHVGMGSYAQVQDHDWDTATRHFERAVALSPNNPLARFYLGNNHNFLGNWREAIAEAEQIVRLAPSDSYERSLASIIFINSNESKRALEILQSVDPLQTPVVQRFFADAYVAVGDADGALTSARAADRWGLEAEALAMAGRDSEALEVLERIEASDNLITRVRARYGDVASAYIWLGDLDRAFRTLERAHQTRSIWIAVVLRQVYLDGRLNDPRWIAFRQDPRYREFVERLRLPSLPPEHPGFAEEQAWLQRKAAAEEANAPIRKIAVLPFENMMRDASQEYFVDGMTEALITELAQIKSLQVRGRTTIMRFKGTDKSIPEIARELDVDGIIEGSVMREGDEVRITAQLIHGPSDVHRWAGTFDSTVTSIFKLHSDMALNIAREIRANLTPQEEADLAEAEDVDSAAYEEYLMGQFYGAQQSINGFHQAADHYRRATELDPNYADAYAGLAFALMGPAIWAWEDVQVTIQDVRAAVQTAQDLDPNSSQAQSILGLVHFFYDFDWVKAEQAMHRSIEFDVDSLYGHWGLSFIRGALRGDKNESRAHANRALEIDPYSPDNLDALGDHFKLYGELDEDIVLRKRALAFDPDHVGHLWNLAEDYSILGRHEEALATHARVLELQGRPTDGWNAAFHARAGNENRAREILRQLDGPDIDFFVDPFSLAMAYSALGDMETALDYVEDAYEAHNSYMMMLRSQWFDPYLDPFRDEPRFQAILEKMNFPE